MTDSKNKTKSEQIKKEKEPKQKLKVKNNTMNDKNQTLNKMNESKLRYYEELLELVLIGQIVLNSDKANDFMHNLDGH